MTPVPITTNGVHPTWSPDGTKIAFSKGEQVYIANSDGSTGIPAPLENGAGHDPIWSPDGTRIAFDGINPQEHDPFVDLHVVSATGGGTPVITPIHYTQWTFASWSADGTRLAYRSTSAQNDGRIRVVGADGGNDVGLGGVDQEDDRTPSWSPDGTRVVFVGNVYSLSDSNFHDYDIYMASTAGGTGAPQKLTMTGDKNFEPMWRPDPAYGPPLPTPPGPTPGTGPTTNPPPPVGGQQKPKVVWITNRIPWSPGTSTVTVGKVECPPDYSCRVAAAGIVPLHGIARAARKTRKVVFGRSHMTVPGRHPRAQAPPHPRGHRAPAQAPFADGQGGRDHDDHRAAEDDDEAHGSPEVRAGQAQALNARGDRRGRREPATRSWTVQRKEPSGRAGPPMSGMRTFEGPGRAAAARRAHRELLPAAFTRSDVPLA